MTDNDEITTLDKLSQSDTEFNASNVKEFTVAKIAVQNKIVAYSKVIKWTDEKTNEAMEKTQMYFYVTIAEVTKSTRLNPQTKKAIQKGYKIDDWKKLIGKEIVATIQSFNNNDFIVWKPQNEIK